MPFSIKGNGNKVLTKYLYYYLSDRQNDIYATKKGAGIPHVHISNIEKWHIPLPPLSEQQRIVSILDKFETLVNSISEGLPREIELRRRQYEYYREQLLTFERR